MPSRTFLVPTLALFAAGLAAEDAVKPAATTPAPAPVTAPSAEPLTVSATRLDEAPILQPYAITTVNRREIDEATPRLGVDALHFTPGVFVQHTAGNQASPYVRGLTGEQSLLMLDGVRLNHAGNRPGPNQYSSMIPGHSLGGIDVVLGSASTVMGSDGLTGAVDFRLAEAGRGVTSVASPWVGTRLASAEQSIGGDAGVDGRVGDFAYSVEGGYAWFGDLIGGSRSGERIGQTTRPTPIPGTTAVQGTPQGDDDEIPNSHFGMWSSAARVAYLGLAGQRFEVSGGFTRQFNAPRPDGYYENAAISTPAVGGGGNQLRRIDRFYDPQDFTYVHGRHVVKDAGVFERVQTTLYWHRHREDQFRDRYTSNALTTTQREEWRDRIDTYGIDLQLTNRIAQVHEVTWGATAYTDRTTNNYFNSTGGVADPAGGTTLPDGSSYDGIGVFVQDLWTISERWDVLAGVRWSSYAWDYTATNNRSGYANLVAPGTTQDFSDSTDAVTGSLRLGFHPTQASTIFAGVGQGFRAPNLTNLAGNDLRGSSTVVVANPDLKPERSLTADLGAKVEQGRDSASIGVFYTVIDDLIQPVYTSPALGTQSNAEEAVLVGGEAAFDWSLPIDGWLPAGHRLAMFNAVSYVSGEAEQLQTDGSTRTVHLSRANRLFGVVGLRYETGPNWWGLVQLRWSDVYDETNAGDASDTRHLTAPSGTGIPGAMPGYAVLDLKAGWRSDGDRYRVQAGLENITNATYRDVGSGTDGAGINAVLAASARF